MFNHKVMQLMSDGSGQSPLIDVESALNTASLDGWEMVSALYTSQGITRLFFKRPVTHQPPAAQQYQQPTQYGSVGGPAPSAKPFAGWPTVTTVPANVDEAWDFFGIAAKRADKDEIKEMYKAYAAEWHPDQHPGDEKNANLHMIRLNAAWIQLKNHCGW